MWLAGVAALLAADLAASPPTAAQESRPGRLSPVDLAPLEASPPPAVIPELPTGDFSTDPVALDPVPVGELVGERTERTRTYANDDGSRTVVSSLVPMHFERDGEWVDIDNSVVADPARPGSFVNAANSWTVRFSPLGEGGVEVSTADGAVSFAPEDGADVAPVVAAGDDATVVTYPEVWPGVDLVYEVGPNRVKEDIVVRAPTERAEFGFVVSGANLQPAGETRKGAFTATGPLAGELSIAAPEVLDRSGRLIDGAARPSAEATRLGPGSDRLAVSVDPTWLRSLQPADFPVRIDPTVKLGAGACMNYKSDGTTASCYVRIGNPDDGIGVWRTVIHFPFSSLAGTVVTER